MASQTPESEAKVAAMFNTIAPRYDFLNRTLSIGQDRRWRKRLIQEIPFCPEGKLLDVATGTGDVVLLAARRHNEFQQFYGVDIAEAMLASAKTKAQYSPNGQGIRFMSMSAEQLDFPTNSFDCLTISFGLRNVVDRQQALAEFHRVLKKSGKLIILEFFQPEATLFARLFRVYFHHVLPKIGGWFSDRNAYTYLPQSVDGFCAPRELMDTLNASGFSLVKKKSFLFGCVCLITAEKL